MPNKDLIQITKADAVAKKINSQYLQMIRKISASAVKLDYDGSIPFDLKNYPAFKNMIDELMNSQAVKSVSIIKQATSEQWLEAYEKNMVLAKPYMKRKLLSEAQQLAYQSRNNEALSAFQNRKIDGLGLSEKIWKYNNQYKGEIEMSLDLALKNGISAQKISEEIRKHLQEPEQLFRRVRNKHGSLHLSKKAKQYSPNQGAYRSSYKNAMRLARTEVNMAYRTSDFIKYNQFDFVIGFEIKRSNNIYGCSLCEGLKGIYPKDFKFVGWHPQCRCYTVPILNSEKDFVAQQKAILSGVEYIPSKQKAVLPPQFKKWYSENKIKIESAKNTPYFIKDNVEFIEKNFTEKKK